MNKERMKKDHILGIVSLVFGLVLAFMTSRIPRSDMAGDPGSRIFPYIACILFIISGVGLLFYKDKKAAEGSEPFFNAEQIKRVIIMFCIMILYYILFDIVGFVPLSIVALFILSTLFAAGQNIQWWKRLLFSVAVTVILFVLFKKVLSVPLPMGFLG